MKVLITGGAGFIGSHTVEEFMNCGYDVAVLDNLSSGLSGNLPDGVRLYMEDIQGSGVDGVFRKEQPDYVVHLAAQVSVYKSMEDPYFDNVINTACTVRLLALCHKYGTKKLIFASSAAVYGNPSCFPLGEEQILSPMSFYSLSKAAAEQYISLYRKEYGLKSCILRFSNVYGPRQNPEGEAGVVAIFTNKLLRREHVTIYGGSQTRDFVYVKDVAIACRKAAESKECGIFNISSSTETTVEALYAWIAGQIHSSESPLRLPMRSGDILKSVLNNAKAAALLGWSPAVLLEAGLHQTLEYTAGKELPGHPLARKGMNV